MIPLLDLTAQYHAIQPEIDAAIRRVLESGHFILGEEVTALEKEVADYLGVKYAVGVASGTDALILALRALGVGPGDEVLVPAYTFFASASAVLLVGGRPVFVDIDPYSYCINPSELEKYLTPATKAVMPVHLYGHPAEMSKILDFAQSHHLKVIEDNAQGFGAEYQGKKTASLGDIGCLSFFPSKNLGGYGDGGMVVTNDPSLAEHVHILRTHGWRKKYFPDELGYNSRLDALQAAILRTKLPHLDEWNERRREIATCYSQFLSNTSVRFPTEAAGCKHVYHLYVIRSPRRDELQTRLRKAGISSEVYYPVPPHLTAPLQLFGWKAGDFPQAERASQETLAIPIYPELSDEQSDIILQTILKASMD